MYSACGNSGFLCIDPTHYDSSPYTGIVVVVVMGVMFVLSPLKGLYSGLQQSTHYKHTHKDRICTMYCLQIEHLFIVSIAQTSTSTSIYVQILLYTEHESKYCWLQLSPPLVCNFVCHERCLSSLTVDCIHLLSEQITVSSDT